MADTLVEGNAHGTVDETSALWGPYWSDESTGVIVYLDLLGGDISFRRTGDKGASWSKTEISSGQVVSVSCWFDKETPGNDGTLLHIAWMDFTNAKVHYRTLDVADGALGTQRTVDDTVTITLSGNQNRLALTQTVSGQIILAFSTQTEIECYKSSDNFATAGTAIADVFETATDEDWCLLFPADTGDDNDACALFWDKIVNEISLKMWDNSAGTWSETIISSMAVDFTHINMDGSVRHSDKHLLFAAHSNDDDAGDDLRTWDLTVDSIGSPTVTAKTNVFTDQAESAQVSVFINQQTNDVYLAYLKGNPTWQATVDVVFHKSVDGMANWGSEQAYSEAAPDDFRAVASGRTVGDAGGRYQPAFFDDDDSDIFVNETNDIEIAVAAAGEVDRRRIMAQVV